MSENYRPGRSNNLATKKYVDNHLGYKIQHGVKDDTYKIYSTVSSDSNTVGRCDILLRITSNFVPEEVEITLDGKSLTAPVFDGSGALLCDENVAIDTPISYDLLTPEMFGDAPFIAELYVSGHNLTGSLYTPTPGDYGTRIVVTGTAIKLSEDFVAAVKAVIGNGKEEGGGGTIR